MRFSSSLIAFVYLGFAAPAVLLVAPREPVPTPSRANLPIDAADLSARKFPDADNVGGPSVPLPGLTFSKGVSVSGIPVLPTKVPRGNSNLVGNVFDTGGKKGNGMAMAHRQETGGGVGSEAEEDPEATHTTEEDETEVTPMLLPPIVPPNPAPTTPPSVSNPP